jgi:hypothetical protein
VPNIRQTARQAGWGAAAAAAITALCLPLHRDFPIVGCLFLVVVVIQSAFSTFAASAIVSVFTIACLDYFFVPPVFTLRISRPLDRLALLSFLVTALVITRLASGRGRKPGTRRPDAAISPIAITIVTTPGSRYVASGQEERQLAGTGSAIRRIGHPFAAAQARSALAD